VMGQMCQHEPILSNALHPRTDVGNQGPDSQKRKLKLPWERKVPDTGFFMCAWAYCLHETGRSDAPSGG
jgi:hypothetical protein